MKRKKMKARFSNYLKKKRLLVHKGKSDFYHFDYTKYGEPVLMEISDYDESSLTIQLIYTDLLKFYRATFLGSFIADQLVIGDVRVLDEPSYAPKFKKPYGKGYGTLLMDYALEEAKKRGATSVTGERVSFDEKQKNRQIHYYARFGFTIDSENMLSKKL